jgi:hypothetical protein
VGPGGPCELARPRFVRAAGVWSGIDNDVLIWESCMAAWRR